MANSASHSFSWALDALKEGREVSRPGWPGESYVVFQKGYPDGIAINKNTAEATGEPEGSVHVFHPYLMIHTTEGFSPWVPTTGDILAMDWQEGESEGPHESEELEKLREDRGWLTALEAAGVDNWQGIDEARRIHEGD